MSRCDVLLYKTMWMQTQRTKQLSKRSMVWYTLSSPSSHRDKGDLRGEERILTLSTLLLIIVITDSDHCNHSDSDHDSGEKGMQQNQREESRFTALRHMILTWQNARCGSSSFSLWCSEVVGETERDDFIYFFSSSLHCLHCCSIYNILSWEVKEWESISCCLFCCSSVCSWSVHERRKYTKIKKQDGRLYDYTIRQNNNTINKTKHHS